MSPRNGLSRRERRKRRRAGTIGARFPSPELSEVLPEPRDSVDPIVAASAAAVEPVEEPDSDAGALPPDEDVGAAAGETAEEPVADEAVPEAEIDAADGSDPADGPSEPTGVAVAESDSAAEEAEPSSEAPAAGDSSPETAEVTEVTEATEVLDTPDAPNIFGADEPEAAVAEQAEPAEPADVAEVAEESEPNEAAEVSEASEETEAAEVLSEAVDEPAPTVAAFGALDGPADEFADLDTMDASSWVRPYVWTGGRTEASADLELETLVSARRPADEMDDVVRDEHRRVLEVCESPCSVSEVAAHLSVPLGVAKTLLSVLAEQDMVVVHSTAGASQAGPDLALMERVLRGLRNL